MFSKILTFLTFFIFNVAFAQVHTLSDFDKEEIKKEITNQLAKDLPSCSAFLDPILILIGGYPGAGKTTLIQALQETHDVTVISWNAIRQALLDRDLKDSPFDREIFETVNQNLLRLCLQRHLNIIIDANAHARNIREIEHFLETEQVDKVYSIVKICLNPPIETLFKRVCARMQKKGLHQGTESDLRRDLNSPKKKFDFNDYALIINTEEISFETELRIVNSFLEPYLRRLDRIKQCDS